MQTKYEEDIHHLYSLSRSNGLYLVGLKEELLGLYTLWIFIHHENTFVW